MLIPKGAGRVSPDSPLSPLVTAAQRYAVPHRTCDNASVIIRKPRPVARNAIQPNRPAINVVTTSASGAVIQWARPRRRYSHAEVYAARPIQAAWPSDTRPPYPTRRFKLAARIAAMKIWLPRVT